MDFPVRSEDRLPVDIPAGRREELREAADPAALHDALMSPPMAPWLDVSVGAPAIPPAGAHVRAPYRHGGEERQR